MSFQISLPPYKRAAGRFVGNVSRALQKVLAQEEKKRGLKQADIARALGVNRATITRQIHGHQNMTASRIAELAWAMGRRVEISFPEISAPAGSNQPSSSHLMVQAVTVKVSVTGTGSAKTGAEKSLQLEPKERVAG